MNRRGFVGLLARAPVISAMAGRAIAEKAAADLTGISSLGAAGQMNAGCAPPSCGPGNIEPGRIKRALANVLFRRELEAELYQQEKRVSFIDPDIAAMRSFSLAAKVAYQRQRNVAVRLGEYETEPRWRRLDLIFEKIARFSLIP